MSNDPSLQNFGRGEGKRKLSENHSNCCCGLDPPMSTDFSECVGVEE